MNFGLLKTAILADGHRGDLSAFVADFVRRAEGMIARELRSTEQTASTTFGESSRVLEGIYNLPLGTLEARRVYFDGRRLVQVGIGEIRGRSGSSDVREFCVLGDRIEFRGVPATGASLELEYLGRLVALAADGDTNALLDGHEALYLHGGLHYLYLHTQDLELAREQKDLFMDVVDTLNGAAGRKLGGASVAVGYDFGCGGGY